MQQNIVENSVMISEQKCIYLHGTQNLETCNNNDNCLYSFDSQEIRSEM